MDGTQKAGKCTSPMSKLIQKERDAKEARKQRILQQAARKPSSTDEAIETPPVMNSEQVVTEEQVRVRSEEEEEEVSMLVVKHTLKQRGQILYIDVSLPMCRSLNSFELSAGASSVLFIVCLIICSI